MATQRSDRFSIRKPPGQHDVLCPANHAGGRIGDRACAQQRQSERFRKRHDHVHGCHQRNSNAGERDACRQPQANLHRPGQQHAQSKRGVAGQRNLRRKFGDGPDLRDGVQPVPAGFGQQRRERRLCCAGWSAISRSGHHHGHEPGRQHPERFGKRHDSAARRRQRSAGKRDDSTARGSMRFAATVTGTSNQQVIWSVTGVGCANPGVCGSIDSTGLYTRRRPSPILIDVVATSSEDITQSGTAFVTINNGPGIFSLSPTSAYAGSAGGFTLLVSGNNFSPSDPGPGSTILVAGAARSTSCASSTQCITSLDAADLQSAGNLPVQLENPDGSLSNTQTFVVLAPGSEAGGIPLTPSAPTSTGNDIVVVELSTNGGSGAAGNVTLNIAAIGAYSVATSSCVLGGSPVIIQRPATGTGTADLCVFSVSALDPSFTYHDQRTANAGHHRQQSRASGPGNPALDAASSRDGRPGPANSVR